MTETQAQAPEITFDDFIKVDIRMGTIVAAEKVEKSKKLLKLQVDFGELGIRQVLAGIGHVRNPENLVNYQTLFVVNLVPREMMGLTSHGMILAVPCGEEDKDLHIPGTWHDGIKNGARVG